LALAEWVLCDGPGYARTVVAAAQTLARALHARGLTPQAAELGYTAGHQLWVRTTLTGVDAVTAADRLYQAGIHVNVLDDLPGLCGEPALRLGTAEPVRVACGSPTCSTWRR
jgi:glycine/serine hydroxymethyltransferase